MIARSKTSKLAAIVISACFSGIGMEAMADTPGALNRSQTRKLLKAAEQQLAQFRQSHKLEKKKDAEGNAVPNLVAHPDSPLIGKTCTLKVEYEKIATASYPATVRENQSTTKPAKAEQSKVVVAAMKTKLRKYYNYSKLFNDLDRPLKSYFDEDVKALRHKVVLHVPSDFKPPEEQPKTFRPVVFVRSVEWDHGTPLPHLVIHADVIESKELGVGSDSDD